MVGASRLGGEAGRARRVAELFLLLFVALNFFVGIFNLLPLLPLDGGHIAIAWFERARSWIYARLRQARPGPGRLLQADAGDVRGDPDLRRVHAADRHRRHRQPDHALLKVSAEVTAVNLGMPAVPPPPLAPRRHSRQIMVGSVPVGGGAPVSVQSMTTTLTADVNATLQQIAELTASGCQIVRVAVPSQDDVEALPAIARSRRSR